MIKIDDQMRAFVKMELRTLFNQHNATCPESLLNDLTTMVAGNRTRAERAYSLVQNFCNLDEIGELRDAVYQVVWQD